MNDKFDRFIQEQIASSDTSGGPLDLAAEKSLWLKKLEQLYALAADCLAKYIADETVRLEYSEIDLTEEWLGTYRVRQAHIMLGRQLVLLKPQGTFLIGSRGRVDMVGPRGSVRLTIVPESAGSPQFRWSLSAATPLQSAEAWVWKIASPPPNVVYIDLTADSFREALMSVVNG
jgi:hypothetical protein